MEAGRKGEEKGEIEKRGEKRKIRGRKNGEA